MIEFLIYWLLSWIFLYSFAVYYLKMEADDGVVGLATCLISPVLTPCVILIFMIYVFEHKFINKQKQEIIPQKDQYEIAAEKEADEFYKELEDIDYKFSKIEKVKNSFRST